MSLLGAVSQALTETPFVVAHLFDEKTENGSELTRVFSFNSILVFLQWPWKSKTKLNPAYCFFSFSVLLSSFSLRSLLLWKQLRTLPSWIVYARLFLKLLMNFLKLEYVSYELLRISLSMSTSIEYFSSERKCMN